MIPFNKAVCLEKSIECVKDVVGSGKLSGDGKYTKLCSKWMENKFNTPKVLLTTSGTTALEMTAILLNIQPGDEIIMPSYTFVSTANAFALRGACLVFVDIKPETMNMNEELIEHAITNKTKAIVVVHYAGIACHMNKILELSKKYNIPIIEDAAHGVMAKYEDKYLGTIGDFGCYSFHDTKNYTMGEGGALLINNEKYIEKAEIIREKGTDRTKFFRGEIDKYTWVDIGSSYLPSEINAAYLYPQLLIADEINKNRLDSWNTYYEGLKKLEENNIIELPKIPKNCLHNAHMFWIKVKDIKIRTEYLNYMKNENNIGCVFHYIPLHSANAGKQYGRFDGEDVYTTQESQRIVRLPMYYEMNQYDLKKIIDMTNDFLG